MAIFIEQTNYEKIAKALILNHDKLWVLVCGNYALSTRNLILSKLIALGIEPDSQLYRDIDYSICTKESIKDRSVYYSDYVIICDIDSFIFETTNVACNRICVNMVGLS